MARCFRRRLGANEWGAEAVEFALVIPVFLTLVFGIVDFGFMINRDTMVNNASREGAREGSLNPNLNAIKCKIRQGLASIETPSVGGDCTPSGTPKVTLTITCRTPAPANAACTGTFPQDAASGGTVVVKVDYAHKWITPVGSTIRPGGMTLTKTTEMRIE